MASRRIRIKTVINIPPRRKNGSDQSSVKNEQSIISDTKTECQNIGEIKVNTEENTCQENTNPSPTAGSVNDLEKENVAESEQNINCHNAKDKDATIWEKLEINSNISSESINEAPKNPAVVRRKFIKPTISVNSFINRKPKISSDKIDVVKSKAEIENIVITKDDEYRKIIDIEPCLEKVQNNQNTIINSCIKQTFASSSCVANCEITYNETDLVSHVNTNLKSKTDNENQPRKPVNLITNAHCSDTEYPPPPPSPSKINRSRIKAVPRLAYRKTSFSASESEDESRRNSNRNRNDSVCSTTSGAAETLVECMSPQRPKEVNPVMQKKSTRTEQTRKMAEARREFQRRFGGSKPDKQRLTMMDLIFYNPVSNPMVDNKKSKNDACDDPELTETVEDENPKNTETQNDNIGNIDEENEMPVPQIKIGPSGEMILDEKSLVIERKELKKQREEIQKTQLVNGDFDTGYGIYKKHKKAKMWTQSETLRFYKALNTLGTDFTLMNELFPKRTRRELKTKFKREEKVNRKLIDKALMQPCNFDYDELKIELELEEKELEQLQKQKEENTKLKQEKMENIRKRKAAKLEAAVNASKEVVPKPSKVRKVKKKKEKLSIENVCTDNSDADESNIDTQSESDEELVLCQRPTRSGRVPKVTQKFDLIDDDKYEKYSNIGNIMRKSKISQEVRPNNIEPGSIMIITDKGVNEEPVYKIYMVTQNNNASPLDLTSEIVSKAVEFKKGVSAENILTISAKATDDEEDNRDDVPSEENNVTIAEDGEISLKSKPAIPQVLPCENTVSNMQCS